MFFVRFIKIFSVLLFLLFGLSSCLDKTANLKPLKIACLGDSITYGYKLEDPAAQSYPVQLARLSRGQWNVLNCGVNGATLLNKGDIPITAQKEYQRAMKFQPDVVVLMLGTNDTKNRNWKHIDGFVSDYIKLVETFRELPTHPHVIACSIPPIFSSHPSGLTEKKVLELNKLLKNSVVATKVVFLDIHTLMLKKQSLFVDGIHPNARGAQEIAGLVLDKISDL